MKEYPLDIENIGEDTYILMSKGHHDIHEFMSKVRSDGYDWPLGTPKHMWCKIMPTRKDGYSYSYFLTTQKTRGSIPATVTREEYGEEMYKAPK